MLIFLTTLKISPNPNPNHILVDCFALEVNITSRPGCIWAHVSECILRYVYVLKSACVSYRSNHHRDKWTP